MSKPVFLSAEWRHLCLLNYEIDPQILVPHLPYGTELDFLDGKTYVSLVAFMFYDTKALGLVPAFFHRNFEEINLRFYVVKKEKNQLKRGVVFIKEVVPSKVLASIANYFYHENYVAMKTSHSVQEGKSYSYVWGKNKLTVKSSGRKIEAAPNSAERWITEHYWGYTKITESKSYEYEVKHPIWELYEVSDHLLNADIPSLYGSEFKAALLNPPKSVFLAAGSGITVHFPTILQGSAVSN
jgi:hypothetical protein